MQYQAGYLLGSVRDHLYAYAKQQKTEGALNGLLRSLATFNIETDINLNAPSGNIPSILAVALNIITRGLPTLASISVEEYFADALHLTARIDEKDLSSIAFPFTAIIGNKLSADGFFKALHMIDPRARDRNQYLNLSDLDSSFERDFLLQSIPAKSGYLAQLLEKQRGRSSFTRDNNKGRVDFSLEIPYDIAATTINKFGSQVQIKHHKTYVVEVDGKKYHTDLIDDLKDFTIGQFARNISHIKEDSKHQDADEFLETVTGEEYVRITGENYDNENYLSDPLTALALTPFGIARLQRIFLQYLISNYENIAEQKTLKIAVVERDFPCAFAAFDDLKRLIHTLNHLAERQIDLPELEIHIFSTPEFINHPLHKGKPVGPLNALCAADFDLLLDISLLCRTSVFKSDSALSANAISIRSAHYVHYQTITGVISAPAVTYCPLVVQLPNEVFEPVEAAASLLRKLLQDIFRKLDFRAGQLPILNRALQLKSVIGLLPTGGGKSLTYQLAAILQPGCTIVVDPIRSLMLDQYNGLREAGIDKCEFINSMLTTAERVFNQHYLLAQGKLQFLFVSPERFVIGDFQKALANAILQGHYFSYVVIDEVHCVSEWGHDFRTPYLHLGYNAQQFCLTQSGQSIPLFGLTATASFDVLADIERELNIREDDGNAVVRFENSIRDEINYIIREVEPALEDMDSRSEQDISEGVGAVKQQTVFELITNKESLLAIFNNKTALNSIAENSFRDYLSSAQREKLIAQSGDEERALIRYKEERFQRLYIKKDPFLKKAEDKGTYAYGIIAFAPHRHGWLGIRNGFQSYGLYDNPDYIEIDPDDKTVHYYDNERLGYFMGSGDDAFAKVIDSESFHHLQLFKGNEESVMMATKAFGMGIDKPNVRMTIHINIPQSIESFVQESGRAGRDGRTCFSMILFNDDMVEIKGKERRIHLDREVLMYFHRNSFKGQIKERVMIFELRNMIVFPNIQKIQMLKEQLNDLFANEEDQFLIKLGNTKHFNRIFINTEDGRSIGYVFLDSGNTGIYRDFGNDALCYEMVEWVKEHLPFDLCTAVPAMREWLELRTVNTQQQRGLEKMLAEMKVGDARTLSVPFTNRYYSKKVSRRADFKLNEAHADKVSSTLAITQMTTSGVLSENTVKDLLTDAVQEGKDYPDFIRALRIEDKVFEQRLLTPQDDLSLELQRAYCIPRSEEDTAKAIYRLVSVHIIDSYTIDYQNKVYHIIFTKKTDANYYDSLEKLLARYTSANAARRQIENLKKGAQKEIAAGAATVISKCLEYLTDFIYDKIKAKRLQAIDDMIDLCQTALESKDALTQNKYIKDTIYYYFNAKYSRLGFVEHVAEGELNASMPDDLDGELTIDKTIKKYISLTENEETGEFISNIKHLRGSVMRMLRSYPQYHPQYRILKSFSLFILSGTIPGLLQEAKAELVEGLQEWKRQENDELDIQAFIMSFKEKIKRHVLNYDIEQAFSDVEDIYYASYYAFWTADFNNQLIEQ